MYNCAGSVYRIHAMCWLWSSRDVCYGFRPTFRYSCSDLKQFKEQHLSWTDFESLLFFEWADGLPYTGEYFLRPVWEQVKGCFKEQDSVALTQQLKKKNKKKTFMQKMRTANKCMKFSMATIRFVKRMAQNKIYFLERPFLAKHALDWTSDVLNEVVCGNLAQCSSVCFS